MALSQKVRKTPTGVFFLTPLEDHMLFFTVHSPTTGHTMYNIQ